MKIAINLFVQLVTFIIMLIIVHYTAILTRLDIKDTNSDIILTLAIMVTYVIIETMVKYIAKKLLKNRISLD